MGRPAVAVVVVLGLAIVSLPSTPAYAAIHGTSGPDRLVGTDGDDRILGHGGRDEISGRAGDDVLSGGRGTTASAPGSAAMSHGAALAMIR